MSESILYIVATPIGNLSDMTFRAVEVLKQADVIAAEDTRRSKPLLNHFGIESPLISCHEYNERSQADKLLTRLTAGETVALISDAGTPLISDPGYYLVRRAQEEGFRVMPVPGACAFIAALSASGLATDRFHFEGFFPAKSSGRKKRLAELSALTTTWGIYESPHRIVDCLQDVIDILGEQRYIVLMREITKTFETQLAGAASDVYSALLQDPNQRKGEFVVLFEGNRTELKPVIDLASEKLLKRLLQELPIKKAAAIVADVTGCRKKEVYTFALGLKEA